MPAIEECSDQDSDALDCERGMCVVKQQGPECVCHKGYTLMGNTCEGKYNSSPSISIISVVRLSHTYYVK